MRVWPDALASGTTANAVHSPCRGPDAAGALGRPRLRREHHLGAHVDAEDVLEVDAGAFGDAAHLLDVALVERGDRRLVACSLTPDLVP